jgi:hypothetical protein
MNWLNCTTSIGPFDDIPGNFIESKGRLMTELVEYWSGHPVPGKIGSGKVLVLSAKKREAAEQLLEQNEKLLGFLKAHGALLNSVKPEMLLDPMDFHRVLDRRVAKYYSHANKNPDETEGAALKHWVALDRDRARFVSASAAAYRATLTQIIKIFVLSRVTPKQFKTMPGVDPAVKETPDGTLSGSQVFSVAEGILLKWLSYHSEKIFKSEARRVLRHARVALAFAERARRRDVPRPEDQRRLPRERGVRSRDAQGGEHAVPDHRVAARQRQTRGARAVRAVPV